MPNLFGLDIAKIIADSVEAAGGVLDATLTVKTVGTRTPGNLTGGTNPTDTAYTGKGFIEELQSDRFPDSVIEQGSSQVVLLGHTFDVAPDANDQITIEGQVFVVVNVLRDPAAATYTCLCSG